MDPNESCPGCRALALRRGRQSVALQDIADRLITDLVPQISQRPDDPVITPVMVVLRHANDQLLNPWIDPRPGGATGVRAIEFVHHPRDEGQNARPIHSSSAPADSRL